MFDDMYVHYVENPSKYRRAVLFIDVLRNDLPEPLSSVSNYLHTIFIKNEILRNNDTKLHLQIKNNSNK
jgi:aspartyl/asparaginyl beta-hydroxylase (cupin superfamily)